jgi:hypothetical protein
MKQRPINHLTSQLPRRKAGFRVLNPPAGEKIYMVCVVFLLAILITGCSIDDDLDMLERSVNEYAALRKKIIETGDIAAIQRGTQTGNQINILVLKISIRAEEMTDAQKKRFIAIAEKYADAVK